jgi:hypothetical protein
MASKEVAPGVHFHLGARYVNHSFDQRMDGNGIIGLDAMMGQHWKLIAEADSRLRVYPAGSYAFGVQYVGPVVITVGMVDQATGRLNFFFGAGYPIGKT